MAAEQQQQSSFIIRPADKSEAGTLAAIHFRAYYDRFFSETAQGRDGKPYGAPLKHEFPVLAEGQNATFFSDYWNSFVRNLDNPDPKKRNYCFVAESEGQPVAFIKGSGAPLGEDMRDIFNRASFGTGKPAPEKVCELSSIYCDPTAKWRGVGKRLVTEFTKAMQGLGYEGMVTRAYDKNDSPAFFEKLGAQPGGTCQIPNDYLKPDGSTASVDIPGVWLYWDKKALGQLATPAP